MGNGLLRSNFLTILGSIPETMKKCVSVKRFSDWYQNLEDPVRKIVKNLRNSGINTICSCGHGMWIQCETYNEHEDLGTIYEILTGMGIRDYHVEVFERVKNAVRHQHIEIALPVNGEYYYLRCDNENFRKGEKQCTKHPNEQ